jgi:hypothetical protein
MMHHMRQHLLLPVPTPVPTPSGPNVISKGDPDYNHLRPFFGWISPDIMKKTFGHTTQYSHLHAGTLLKKGFKL